MSEGKKEKQQLPQLLPSLFSGNARNRSKCEVREGIAFRVSIVPPAERQRSREVCGPPTLGKWAARTSRGSLFTRSVLVSNLVRIQVADWVFPVVGNAINEVAGWRLIAIGVPRHIGLGNRSSLPLASMRAALLVDVGA